MYHFYDMETYPNCWTITLMPEESCTDKTLKATYIFDDFTDDERRTANNKRLREHLAKIYRAKDVMVGFNNIGFDYPLLHWILEQPHDVRPSDVYNKAMEIISAHNSDDRFAHRVPANKRFIKQADLFLIHHFDNKARSTSLKMLEVNMRADNIEDLPFPVGTYITEEQIDVLVKYNQHDVMMTYAFFKKSVDAIEFRNQLSEKYEYDFSNHNDTKIGKDFFILKLEESNPGCCYKKQGNSRRIRQTKRSSIALKDVILPYATFDLPAFQAVKEWFQNQVITETKGVFSDIPSGSLGSVAAHAEMKTRQKVFYKPLADADKAGLDKNCAGWWLEEKTVGKEARYVAKWNSADTLNVVVDGFRYDFGLGGLHGACKNTVFESDDEHVIFSVDVSSYYPNLSIQNRLYPEHLGEHFCDIYQQVFEERKKYAKGTPENAVLKLALNGTYGASNDVYSPFYDPQFTMAITINGQLLLCKLADMLLKVNNLKIIMVNTDGLEMYVERRLLYQVKDILKQWEQITKLTLEDVIYKRLCIRDVNNYIGIFDNGKIKRKGVYEYENLGWHQNQSMLIVPKAAERALLYNENYEQFIQQHDDIYDFMLRVKVNRTSKLFSGDQQIQNTTRYYISTDGERLFKHMPPIASSTKKREVYANADGQVMDVVTPADRRKAEKKGFNLLVKTIDITPEWRIMGVHPDRLVTVVNDVKQFERSNIDYSFYYEEARKLILPILQGEQHEQAGEHERQQDDDEHDTASVY